MDPVSYTVSYGDPVSYTVSQRFHTMSPLPVSKELAAHANFKHLFDCKVQCASFIPSFIPVSYLFHNTHREQHLMSFFDSRKLQTGVCLKSVMSHFHTWFHTGFILLELTSANVFSRALFLITQFVRKQVLYSVSNLGIIPQLHTNFITQFHT